MSIRHILGRFARDRRGVAAAEFAMVAPIFIFVLLGIGGIGGAITSQFAVEKKVRLAVEGVIRYGWDETKIKNFAEADAAKAFGGVSQSDGVRLTVNQYRICRLGEAVEISGGLSAACGTKAELWIKIIASKPVAGPFGSTLNLTSRTDVMAEP